VCNTDSSGKAVNDPSRIGARGGGFAISRGATAQVKIRRSEVTRVDIEINARRTPEAVTTRWAIENLLKAKGFTLHVAIKLRIMVPMASGFGTSAAGTLASCLALSNAADLPVTLNELGAITHVAEVVNRTGLGTASALLGGGFVIVREPGAPGIGSVDKLLFPQKHSLVCAYLGPMPTREVLAKPNIAEMVNTAARHAMQSIRQDPRLESFLAESRNFGSAVGFQTPNVARLISAMVSAGSIGAAQNMIGEAVHGVVKDSNIKNVMKIVRRAFPSARVFAAQLDNFGVRLLEPKPKH